MSLPPLPLPSPAVVNAAAAAVNLPAASVSPEAARAMLDLCNVMNEQAKGSYVDHDAASDLLFTRSQDRTPSDGERIGDLLPASRALQPVDYYKASTYRMGAFICHVLPYLAFRSGWKFVQPGDDREPIDDALKKKLNVDTKKWKMRVNVPVSVDCACTFGRSIVFKEDLAGTGKRKRQGLRITPIEDEYIEWNGNSPSVFKPLVWHGRQQEQITLEPEEVVCFVHNPDYLGHRLDGRPAHFHSYKTIVRAERITRAFCNLVENRGMGLTTVGLLQGTLTDADIKKYTAQFGNPGSRAFLFYPKNLMEIEVQEGIKPGFQFPEVDQRLTRHFSMGTGVPGMRAEGEQVGKVTGSKTDQDNTSETYSWLHELYEDNIIDIYALINPEYADAEFELDWPYDIPMDPAEKADIFDTYVRAITAIPEMLTVGQSYKLLDMKVPEGMDEKQILAEAMNEVQQELAPTPQEQQQFELEQQKIDVSAKAKAGKGKPAKSDRDAVRDEKLEVARRLFEGGLTTPQVEKALRALAGSALGSDTLAAIRKETRK